jgi:hypothetical protein
MPSTATVMALLLASSARGDLTYGLDHPGSDYNITAWASPPSAAADHYKSSALACQAICVADPHCCSWTYVPPLADDRGERCCLKGSVPAPIARPYWTGAEHGGKCAAPPAPTPPPFPGPAWVAPTVHNSPLCTHLPNWHDIAGALFWKGFWHVFQGSSACNGVRAGWHHAVSSNLVDWTKCVLPARGGDPLPRAPPTH